MISGMENVHQNHALMICLKQTSFLWVYSANSNQIMMIIICLWYVVWVCRCEFADRPWEWSCSSRSKWSRQRFVAELSKLLIFKFFNLWVIFLSFLNTYFFQYVCMICLGICISHLIEDCQFFSQLICLLNYCTYCFCCVQFIHSFRGDGSSRWKF